MRILDKRKRYKNMSFDKRKIYDEKIAPLVHELYVLCDKEKIPFFFEACVADPSVTEKLQQEWIYRAQMLSPAELDMQISNDYITSCLKIYNGYTPVLHPDVMDVLNDFENNTALGSFTSEDLDFEDDSMDK